MKKTIRNPFKRMKNFRLFQELRKKGVKALNVSDGNKKLISNDFIHFIVWNLPAVTTCPFRTPHCEQKCYAKKAENLYPEALPARRRNLQESKSDDFVERAVFTILSKIYYDKKERYIIVRIHESGDFYNKEYAAKWLQIAEALKGERVVFIAYTKSVRYFDGVNLPNNFRLRASIWDDTKPEELEIMRRNDWPIYTAVDKFQKGDTFTRCRCKDCGTCKKCWSKRKDIRCEIH